MDTENNEFAVTIDNVTFKHFNKYCPPEIQSIIILSTLLRRVLGKGGKYIELTWEEIKDTYKGTTLVEPDLDKETLKITWNDSTNDEENKAHYSN